MLRSMRRTLRFARVGLDILWLTLVVFMSVMWVRSYWRWDNITRTHEHESIGDQSEMTASVISSWGRVEISSVENHTRYSPIGIVFRAWIREHDEATWERRSDRATPPGPGAKRFAWEVQRLGDRSSGGTYVSISFPYWTPMLAIAAPMLILAPMRVRRRRVAVRRAAGLCVQCGYDLRASPERCPECGTPAPAPAQPQPQPQPITGTTP